MISETKHLRFKFDADGLTEIVRDFWGEKNYFRAYEILSDGLGMPNDLVFDVLAGKKKLVLHDENSDSFDLVDDNWIPPSHYSQPSFSFLMNNGKEGNKLAPVVEKAKNMSILAHTSKIRRPGQGLVRGGSPIGVIPSELFETLSRNLFPPPTKEEWQKYWDKAVPEGTFFNNIPSPEVDCNMPTTESVTTEPVVRSVPVEEDHFVLQRTMADPLTMIDIRAEMDNEPCPDPDPELSSMSGYILPNGDFYGCKYMMHGWLASRLLEKQGIVSPDPGKTAEKLGWVSIHSNVTGRNILWVSDKKRASSRPTKAQIDTTRFFAAKYNFTPEEITFDIA